LKLTNMKIKKAKPDSTTQRGNCLMAGVFSFKWNRTGGKLWRYKFRFDEKHKLLALSKYPDVSLQEARRRHQEAREQLARGIDPSAKRQ